MWQTRISKPNQTLPHFWSGVCHLWICESVDISRSPFNSRIGRFLLCSFADPPKAGQACLELLLGGITITTMKHAMNHTRYKITTTNQVKLQYHQHRVDIWRDRCDQRSCKILVSRVNLSENNANCVESLHKMCKNLPAYLCKDCVNIYSHCVHENNCTIFMCMYPYRRRKRVSFTSGRTLLQEPTRVTLPSSSIAICVP